MRLNTFVNRVLDCIDDEDIVIFSNSELSCLGYKDENRFFYFLNDNSLSISFALGVALSTNNRVILLCTDQDLISNFSSILQAGVSNRTNLIIICFTMGSYDSIDGINNIGSSIKSFIHLSFGSGFITYDHTNHFTPPADKNYKNFFKRINNASSSILVLLNSDTSSNKNIELPNINKFEMVNNLSLYIESKIEKEEKTLAQELLEVNDVLRKHSA